MSDPDPRQEIYRKSDEARGRGVHAEVNDPDSPHYYEDPETVQAEFAERLKEDLGKSNLDRSKETRARINAKPEPEEDETLYFQEDAHQVYTEFRARHPEITDTDWKRMNDELFIQRAPDVLELRGKLNASNTRADFDRLLERAADGYATVKKQREDAAYVRSIQRDRSPMDENALDARIKKTMKEAR